MKLYTVFLSKLSNLILLLSVADHIPKFDVIIFITSRILLLKSFHYISIKHLNVSYKKKRNYFWYLQNACKQKLLTRSQKTSIAIHHSFNRKIMKNDRKFHTKYGKHVSTSNEIHEIREKLLVRVVGKFSIYDCRLKCEQISTL